MSGYRRVHLEPESSNVRAARRARNAPKVPKRGRELVIEHAPRREAWESRERALKAAAEGRQVTTKE